MYFYIDESGHSGLNLFDEQQPFFYYGVLSSTANLDVELEKDVETLRNKLKIPRLHANELGNGNLIKIIDDIYSIHQKFEIRFDFFALKKIDYAVICFFDQVFDHGLNPATTYTSYWTPLRYVLLLKLAVLFCDDSLKKSWEARIEKDHLKANSLFIEVCNILKDRVLSLPDKRSQQLIFDALLWAKSNPDEIHYL